MGEDEDDNDAEEGGRERRKEGRKASDLVRWQREELERQRQAVVWCGGLMRLGSPRRLPNWVSSASSSSCCLFTRSLLDFFLWPLILIKERRD